MSKFPHCLVLTWLSEALPLTVRLPRLHGRQRQQRGRAQNQLRGTLDSNSRRRACCTQCKSLLCYLDSFVATIHLVAPVTVSESRVSEVGCSGKPLRPPDARSMPTALPLPALVGAILLTRRAALAARIERVGHKKEASESRGLLLEISRHQIAVAGLLEADVKPEISQDARKLQQS